VAVCLQQPWVQELIARHQDAKLVFSADGNAAETRQHLSTGLSQDHLVSRRQQLACLLLTSCGLLYCVLQLTPRMSFCCVHSCLWCQFLSLLQNNMIADMLVLYAAPRRIITVLKLGVPVCGHPTIVHGMKQQQPKQLSPPWAPHARLWPQLAALSPCSSTCSTLPLSRCPAHRQILIPDPA
jgi:hypothetical protein